ncbi:unnamed protein product [Vitrella brassicaformis CCMP3155]|uniref:Uncharacterized protein n=2 Tax=Vitrella brassicaformis TaxID=1169539 RepID=A0A0G4H2S1_VITBC|nr:unnamed protein product [Vitrella brassicaformis CCMP3155]|eukprot:CEM37963.1 unnamed protein product [Vitrella brassicaformis CCMP3155]
MVCIGLLSFVLIPAVTENATRIVKAAGAAFKPPPPPRAAKDDAKVWAVIELLTRTMEIIVAKEMEGTPAAAELADKLSVVSHLAEEHGSKGGAAGGGDGKLRGGHGGAGTAADGEPLPRTTTLKPLKP